MGLGDIGINKGATQQLPTVYQELIDIFDETVIMLKTSARHRGHKASGNLIASIRFEPLILGGQFRFQLILPSYYEQLDKGRAPTENKGDGSLERSLSGAGGWISSSAKGRALLSKFMEERKLKNKKKANKTLAYLIARKIHRFGYKGTFFYSNVIKDGREFVKSVIKRVAVAAKKDILVEIKTLK